MKIKYLTSFHRFKNYIYNILDIILFYSIILFLFALIYLSISILTILYISYFNIYPSITNDICICYFNGDTITNISHNISENVTSKTDIEDLNTSDSNMQNNKKNNKFASYFHNITIKTKRRLY